MGLPEHHLRLAIADALLDGIDTDTLVEKLSREDSDEVRRITDEIKTSRASLSRGLGDYFRQREAKKRKPLPFRQSIGLRLPDIARRLGMRVSTLVTLLVNCRLVELVPYGGTQKRHLVSDEACAAGFGHNVDPKNRIGHLEGFNRSAVFPVFYEECLDEILSRLGYDDIRATVSSLASKRAKRDWLLEHHGYLPDEEIASLAGCSRRTITRARAAQPSLAQAA